MKERTVERRLVRGVKRAGGEVRKLIWGGRRHAPDRIVIMQPRPAPLSQMQCFMQQARVIFVELKAPRKKPRPGQQREHDRLIAMGCDVRTLNTPEKVDRFLEEL